MTNSKFKINGLLFCGVIFFSPVVFSTGFESSIWSGIGEGAHGDNGSLIIGANKKTEIFSGYYEANDITGDSIAECKFLFRGNLQPDNSVDIFITSAHPDFIKDRSKVIEGKLQFLPTQGKLRAIIFPKQMPPSCEWLYEGLPSYRPPKDFKFGDGLLNEFDRNGDWIAVGIVKSKQAYFYGKPDGARKGRAFIVAGDLIYIYKETKNWYFVKFQAGKKETTGWIKKSDTIQISG